MAVWIAQNLGTILTGLAVAGIVAAVVAVLARDQRKGRHLGCGCGCDGCPHSLAGGCQEGENRKAS
ncbi:MAG: FeoB-associated Cys-rich membrane protein [Clostridium sp.]|nr:FeoB-associated Cys-rich membrane protein [Clostridium sp.]